MFGGTTASDGLGYKPERPEPAVAVQKCPSVPESAIRRVVASVISHWDFNLSGAGPVIEFLDGRSETIGWDEPPIGPMGFLDYSPRPPH